MEARLIGWKRIAAHLGCNERTARRWGVEENLPVHRQPHEQRSTVFAYPHELNAWLKARTAEPLARAAPSARNRSTGSRLWGSRGLAFTLMAGAGLMVIALGWLTIARLNSPQDTVSEGATTIQLYEEGRGLWRQRGEEPNRRAIGLLTLAVERDPDFAEAWAALASAWLTLPTYSETVSIQQAEDEAVLAATEALSLDPTLAEPRSVMATLAQRHGDWARSEQIFEAALAAEPDHPTILLWYAGHYRELGMFDYVWPLTDRAAELDPNAPPIMLEPAMNHLLEGRVDQAEPTIDLLWNDIGLRSPIVWIGKWFALTMRGDFAALEAWAAEAPFNVSEDLLRRYARVKAETAQDSDPDLPNDIAASVGDAMPAWLAYHLLEHLDRPDLALDVASSEARTGRFVNSVVMFDPAQTHARQSERFVGVAEDLGYLEYWRQKGAPSVCRTEADTPVCRAIAMSE